MAGPQQQSGSSDIVVGIDLGTTFSVISWIDAQGRPVTISNAEGDLTTPSVVFLDREGAIVGKEAVKAAEFEPERVAQHPKRDMGQTLFRQPVRGEQFPPEALQALILAKLKRDAELKLGTVSRAVITVPAYFNEPRRKATQDAGRIAGWEVLDIINEPTAAAIAFGVGQQFIDPAQPNAAPETILVYDLGGGTFDVTLMRIDQNEFTVLATAGDVQLGGIDWDARIVDFVAQAFLDKFGVDPRGTQASLLALRLEAEDAKRALSTRTDVHVVCAHEGQKLRIPLSRSQFEALTGDLVDRTQMTLKRLMRDAKVEFADLTRVLVVGGSTRMPMITRMIERETGRSVDRSLSADEAVSHGAALYGKSLASGAAGTLRVRNVNSHDLGVLGIERSTGMNRRQVMIPRNTPLPAESTHTFATFQDGQTTVLVPVVEGGDASGMNATHVGRLVVHDLPPRLPKGTTVAVKFKYLANGRLDVQARIPSVDRVAALAIERASGMADTDIAAWSTRIATGLPDTSSTVAPPPVAAAPVTPPDEGPSPDESSFDFGQALVADEPTAADEGPGGFDPAEFDPAAAFGDFDGRPESGDAPEPVTGGTGNMLADLMAATGAGPAPAGKSRQTSAPPSAPKKSPPKPPAAPTKAEAPASPAGKTPSAPPASAAKKPVAPPPAAPRPPVAPAKPPAAPVAKSPPAASPVKGKSTAAPAPAAKPVSKSPPAASAQPAATLPATATPPAKPAAAAKAGKTERPTGKPVPPKPASPAKAAPVEDLFGIAAAPGGQAPADDAFDFMQDTAEPPADEERPDDGSQEIFDLFS